MNFDENALICDLAETYHILDYRSLPVKLVATLSAGLRADSRILMRLADAPVKQEIVLLASIADRIELFRYGFMGDKSGNAPVSIVESLYGSARVNPTGVKGFSTSSDFESTLAKLRGE